MLHSELKQSFCSAWNLGIVIELYSAITLQVMKSVFFFLHSQDVFLLVTLMTLIAMPDLVGNDASRGNVGNVSGDASEWNKSRQSGLSGWEWHCEKRKVKNRPWLKGSCLMPACRAMRWDMMSIRGKVWQNWRPLMRWIEKLDYISSMDTKILFYKWIF